MMAREEDDISVVTTESAGGGHESEIQERGIQQKDILRRSTRNRTHTEHYEQPVNSSVIT